ncbi:TIGR04157 family glycosyltransferase [Bacteroides faecichinchillae]|uniref:Glycosyltransferase n=1 Tax=Bacteroides faecichinchillae TaxID=871325 RepID=A0A1M4U889_9BACE|nr:TIGR04157 family glycosyltransferase [Bacteroides faecichinchillae]THG69762.1 TIGR04157 family glycosyltransferase [Bacteroides faecichinchillae]SHE52838.1 glycosyltransferase [Bacteroides faecichinchillae]
MTKKKVYIFNSSSRAAVYGIGTYIAQLTDCLKEEEIEFGLIYIHVEGEEVTVTEQEGYQLISIPSTSYSNPQGREYYARNIAYLLKEFIPVEKGVEYIFHLNFMGNPALVSNLKKMFRCKVILVAHYSNWSFTLLGDNLKLKRILAKRPKKRDYSEQSIVKDVKENAKMIAQCDKFVCIARHSMDSFTSICRIDAKKTVLINNALKDCYIPVDEEHKRILRHKYYIQEGIPLLIFAGRLDEVKGIAFLIQAFRKVLETYTNARLLIAGDGSFNRWLKEAKDIWSQIIFTGRIEKEVLYELYHIADIGIMSSLHEEFGFVAIEMMMNQLPVIVSDTGGLSEIVEDGISGLKVPVMNDSKQQVIDVDALSAKMIQLIEHPDFAKILAENARSRFLEKYDLTIFREKMLNLYREV